MTIRRRPAKLLLKRIKHHHLGLMYVRPHVAASGPDNRRADLANFDPPSACNSAKKNPLTASAFALFWLKYETLFNGSAEISHMNTVQLASCLTNAQPLPAHRPVADDNLIGCTSHI